MAVAQVRQVRLLQVQQILAVAAAVAIRHQQTAAQES
jgi:hypothetical protein